MTITPPKRESRLIEDLSLGEARWPVSILPDKRVEFLGTPLAFSPPGLYDLVRDALESPYRFEPLRRALTPDDRVVVVVDEALPGPAQAVTAVLEHLGSAGIAMQSVTLLAPAGAPNANWLDDLPDTFLDVKTEVHDPTDRKKLAYLAATQSGKRIYLNRTLVEADFVVVIGCRRFDPEFGLSGAEDLLFPQLSDAATIEAKRGAFRYKIPTPDPDAVEVAELLGSPFFVQVQDDGYRTVEVLAGLPNSLAEGHRRHNAIWRRYVAVRPDTVIATVSPDARFPELAAAAINSARIVTKGGKIVLLAPPLDLTGQGIAILRGCENPSDARKILAREKPDDWTPCHLWATAARRGRLYVANLNADIAEELFAIAIDNARELERLLTSSERVLLLPDAHRTLVGIHDGGRE